MPPRKSRSIHIFDNNYVIPPALSTTPVSRRIQTSTAPVYNDPFALGIEPSAKRFRDSTDSRPKVNRPPQPPAPIGARPRAAPPRPPPASPPPQQNVLRPIPAPPRAPTKLPQPKPRGSDVAGPRRASTPEMHRVASQAPPPMAPLYSLKTAASHIPAAEHAEFKAFAAARARYARAPTPRRQEDEMVSWFLSTKAAAAKVGVTSAAAATRRAVQVKAAAAVAARAATDREVRVSTGCASREDTAALAAAARAQRAADEECFICYDVAPPPVDGGVAAAGSTAGGATAGRGDASGVGPEAVPAAAAGGALLPPDAAPPAATAPAGRLWDGVADDVAAAAQRATQATVAAVAGWQAVGDPYPPRGAGGGGLCGSLRGWAVGGDAVGVCGGGGGPLLRALRESPLLLSAWSGGVEHDIVAAAAAAAGDPKVIAEASDGLYGALLTTLTALTDGAEYDGMTDCDPVQQIAVGSGVWPVLRVKVGLDNGVWRKLACCDGWLHRVCYDACVKATAPNSKCPRCRKPWTNV